PWLPFAREVEMKIPYSLISTILLAVACPVQADDWPQLRGPDRTGISHETGLLKSWPSDGPRLLWTYKNAGIGYSGPSIIGSRLFTMGARGNTQYLFALNADNGNEVWATAVGPLFRNGYGDGPRGTPTTDGNILYALGGQGKLICAEIATGKKRWQVDMHKDLHGKMMSGWGYTESPLVDGDKLICTPGGDSGTLAALNKNTGKVIWRSTE